MWGKSSEPPYLANSYIDEFMTKKPEKDAEYQKLAKVIAGVAIYEMTGDVPTWNLCQSSKEKMDTPFAFLMNSEQQNGVCTRK